MEGIVGSAQAAGHIKAVGEALGQSGLKLLLGGSGGVQQLVRLRLLGFLGQGGHHLVGIEQIIRQICLHICLADSTVSDRVVLGAFAVLAVLALRVSLVGTLVGGLVSPLIGLVVDPTVGRLVLRSWRRGHRLVADEDGAGLGNGHGIPAGQHQQHGQGAGQDLARGGQLARRVAAHDAVAIEVHRSRQGPVEPALGLGICGNATCNGISLLGAGALGGDVAGEGALAGKTARIRRDRGLGLGDLGGCGNGLGLRRVLDVCGVQDVLDSGGLGRDNPSSLRGLGSPVSLSDLRSLRNLDSPSGLRNFVSFSLGAQGPQDGEYAAPLGLRLVSFASFNAHFAHISLVLSPLRPMSLSLARLAVISMPNSLMNWHIFSLLQTLAPRFGRRSAKECLHLWIIIYKSATK